MRRINVDEGRKYAAENNTRRGKLPVVVPPDPPTTLDRQLQVRVGQDDVDRLARIDQLTGGRGKSWAVRTALEHYEQELLALADRQRHDRKRSTGKGRKR